jgi:hypothetical protein
VRVCTRCWRKIRSQTKAKETIAKGQNFAVEKNLQAKTTTTEPTGKDKKEEKIPRKKRVTKKE